MDCTIHFIYHYALDNSISFDSTYPVLVSDLSAGQLRPAPITCPKKLWSGKAPSKYSITRFYCALLFIYLFI